MSSVVSNQNKVMANLTKKMVRQLTKLDTKINFNVTKLETDIK